MQGSGVDSSANLPSKKAQVPFARRELALRPHRSDGCFYFDMLYARLTDLDDSVGSMAVFWHEFVHSLQFAATPLGHWLSTRLVYATRSLLTALYARAAKQRGFQVKAPLASSWSKSTDCPDDLRTAIMTLVQVQEMSDVIFASIARASDLTVEARRLSIESGTPVIVRHVPEAKQTWYTGLGLRAIIEGWATVVESKAYAAKEERKGFWREVYDQEHCRQVPTLQLYTLTRDIVNDALDGFWDDTLVVLSDFSMLSLPFCSDGSLRPARQWHPGWRFLEAIDAARRVGPFERFQEGNPIAIRYASYYKLLADRLGWIDLGAALTEWRQAHRKRVYDPIATLGIDWSALARTGSNVRGELPAAIAFPTPDNFEDLQDFLPALLAYHNSL